MSVLILILWIFAVLFFGFRTREHTQQCARASVENDNFAAITCCSNELRLFSKENGYVRRL
jgi:hypothetical protein